jgi:hypothetical protein
VLILVEFVKGKALIGPFVIFFGGLFSLIVSTNATLDIMDRLPGNDAATLPAILYIIFGVIGLLIGLSCSLGKSILKYITLGWGVIGIIGMIIMPVPPASIPYYHYIMIWIGPLVVVLGGVFSLLMKE